MPWWGWLLVGALGATIVVLIIILLTRKTEAKGLSEEERVALAKLEKSKLEEQLAAEHRAQEAIKKIVEDQNARLKSLQECYNDAKKLISIKKQEEFDAYFADADSAGRELDRLLGISGTGSNKPR